MVGYALFAKVIEWKIKWTRYFVKIYSLGP